MCVIAVPPLARGLEGPAAVVAAGELTSSECVHPRLKIDRRHLDVLIGERADLAGTLEEGTERAPAGAELELQRRQGRIWRTLSHTSTRAGGRFSLSYVPWRTGEETLRVVFTGDSGALPTARIAGRLEAFRAVGASWYGGGGELACGGELTSSTIGVANKTLPCGTMVTLRYDGRTIRVPVIDRGPYVEGREFDLTEATKRELGFGDTGDVWTTS
jgi:rare lipoprotein A